MNKFRLFIAALLTVVTLSHSKPSQAAVGAFVGAPLLIAGVVVAGGGAITYALGKDQCGSNEYGLCSGLWGLFTAPIILIGLVLLDGEQQVAFGELSPEQAKSLGVSAADAAIFNAEVDQVNMLMQDVKEELSQIKKPTVNDSAAAWSNVKDMVSPETFAVMKKIAEQK